MNRSDSITEDKTISIGSDKYRITRDFLPERKVFVLNVSKVDLSERLQIIFQTFKTFFVEMSLCKIRKQGHQCLRINTLFQQDIGMKRCPAEIIKCDRIAKGYFKSIKGKYKIKFEMSIIG